MDVGGFIWRREGQPLAWVLSPPHLTLHRLWGGSPGPGAGERLTGVWGPGHP